MSDADWDDDRPIEDWEYPDGDDDDSDDSTPTRDCPHCGTSVYDDAVACPNCGEFFMRESAVGQTPLWVKATALALLAAMLAALWSFL